MGALNRTQARMDRQTGAPAFAAASAAAAATAAAAFWRFAVTACEVECRAISHRHRGIAASSRNIISIASSSSNDAISIAGSSKAMVAASHNGQRQQLHMLFLSQRHAEPLHQYFKLGDDGSMRP